MCVRRYFLEWSDYFYYDESSPSCLRWKIDRFAGKCRNIERISKGDIAGSLCSDGYFRVKLLGKSYGVHRVVFELVSGTVIRSGAVINHRGRNPSNNTFSNLEETSQAHNARNGSLSRNNKSGVNGVGYRLIKDIAYWYTQWSDLDGRRKSKYFSVNTYGDDFAKHLAIQYRDMMIKELNKEGAGYSNLHGTRADIDKLPTLH